MLFTLKVKTEACSRQPAGLLEGVGERHRLVGRLEVAAGRDQGERTGRAGVDQEVGRRGGVARVLREHSPVRLPTVAEVPRLGIGITSKSSRRDGAEHRGPSAGSPRAAPASRARTTRRRVLRQLGPGQRRPGACRTRTVWVSDCWLVSSESASDVGSVALSKSGAAAGVHERRDAGQVGLDVGAGDARVVVTAQRPAAANWSRDQPWPGRRAGRCGIWPNLTSFLL